ncbi:YchJ family protein [Niveibacterium terrae]|uniref:YchJ family protein n=1 Tax=Niveibacterium terrae TaxID=3373598 RepID=UPI003A8F7852
MKKLELACPCGSGKPYAHCCGPLHAGEPAASAEALMRSRYSAFALNLPDYLLASWHPSTRPADLTEEGPAPRWIGLKVLAAASAGDAASVEFVATCRVGGRAQRLHEKSRFVLEDGRWYYVDGEF